jgi:hypothetical protein
MQHTALCLTQFRVEKLQCIGGGNGVSPYRITPVIGPELGRLGRVMEAGIEAHNIVRACGSTEHPVSWRRWLQSMPLFKR